MPAASLPLMFAATGDAIAALLHVGCIAFGAPWYRFFGAGERMALMADAGNPRATLVTSGIVLVLLAWTAYALSGAGALPTLPLLRTVLFAIAGVLVLRGVGGIGIALSGRHPRPAFWWWSSLICLALGALHGVGAAGLAHGA